MGNQFEKTPTQEANSEEYANIEEFYRDLQKSVMEEVYEMMEVKEEDVDEETKKAWEEYGLFLTNSMFVSIEAGEYFKQLIPSSPNKPKKEYSHDTQLPSIVFFERERIGLARKLKKEPEFNDFAKDYNSEVAEERKDKYVLQTAYYRNTSDEGRIITEELLHNYLREESNIAKSQLVISDWQTGVKLDVNQLLPNEYTLLPSEMMHIETECDLEKLTKINKFIPVDLKYYSGTKGAQGEFVQAPGFNEVRYEDLTKKGSRLALFHEIAHSWQDAYDGCYERGEFEDIHEETAGWLKILDKSVKELEKGEISKDKHEFRTEYVRKKLEEKGVNFNINNFIYNGENAKDNDIIFAYSNEERYIAQCDKLRDILKLYEKKERDAWAHAVLMIRFLRKKSIDLEPELQKLEDFRSVIDPCLQSYQKKIEKQIKFVNGKVGFNRRNGESKK